MIPKGVPGEGYLEDFGWPEDGARLDMRPAVEALGREMLGFEESVLDTVEVFRKVYAKELKELDEGRGEKLRENKLKTRLTDGKVA